MPETVFKPLELPEIYHKAGGKGDAPIKLASGGIRTLTAPPDNTGPQETFQFYEDLAAHHDHQATRGENQADHSAIAETYRKMANSVQKAQQPDGTGIDKRQDPEGKQEGKGKGGPGTDKEGNAVFVWSDAARDAALRARHAKAAGQAHQRSEEAHNSTLDLAHPPAEKHSQEAMNHARAGRHADAAWSHYYAGQEHTKAAKDLSKSDPDKAFAHSMATVSHNSAFAHHAILGKIPKYTPAPEPANFAWSDAARKAAAESRTAHKLTSGTKTPFGGYDKGHSALAKTHADAAMKHSNSDNHTGAAASHTAAAAAHRAAIAPENAGPHVHFMSADAHSKAASAHESAAKMHTEAANAPKQSGPSTGVGKFLHKHAESIGTGAGIGTGYTLGGPIGAGIGGAVGSLAGSAVKHAAKAFFNEGADMENTVDFALDLTQELKSGRWVTRTAPVGFKAGNYPDKSFNITPAELQTAIQGFKGPIDLDLEHKRTILDGKLGKLMKLEAGSTDFSVAKVTVALPKWLDEMAPTKSVSLSFDRPSKTVKGCALTINPKIEEAALFAAFAADESAMGAAPPPPEAAPQPIAGDIPAPPGGEMGGCLHGQKLFQQVADIVNKTLQSAKENEGVYDAKYLKRLEQLLKLCNDAGAETVADSDKGTVDSEKEKDKEGNAQVGGEGSSEGPGFTKTKTTPAATKTARETQLEADLAAERKKRLEETSKRIASDAVMFANDVIAVRKKAIPAQRQTLIQNYVTAATADAKASETADFSLSQPGPMVKNLKAMFDAAPELHFHREMLGDGDGAGTLPADFAAPPAGGKMSPQRKAELMCKTDLGKEVHTAKTAATTTPSRN